MKTKEKKIRKIFSKIFSSANVFKKLIFGSLLLGSAGIIAGSTYSISQNLRLGGDYIPGYAGRVELNPFANGINTTDLNKNSSFGKFKLEGKEYDFDKKEVLDNAVSQAAKVLNEYNNSLGRANFSVNFSNVNTIANNNATRLLNLNFRAQSFPQRITKDSVTQQDIKVDYNLNNAWFDLVHLNQLSIDRYGIDFNVDGSSSTTNSPKFEQLLSFNDVGTTTMKLLSPSNGNFDGLSFNIYSKDIPKEQVRVLANQDESKYVISPQAKNSGASNDWFVWLDKDILALKLFYVYQTYVFHDQRALTQNGVTNIIGNPGLNNGQTSAQIANWKQIKDNFDALSADDKSFAEAYINTFHPSVGNNWVDVVGDATNPDKFTSSRISEIYNRLKAGSNAEGVKIFQNYLLNVITPGTNGNWKTFFPKFDSTFNKNFQEKIDLTKPEEISGIFALNDKQEVIQKPSTPKPANNQAKDSNSTPAAANTKNSSNPKPANGAKTETKPSVKNYKASENVIHLAVDKTLAPDISNSDLFNRLTKFQVRFLKLRQNAISSTTTSGLKLVRIWPSAVYTNDNLTSNYVATQLYYQPSLSIAINNPLSQINGWLWYLIGALFFALVLGIVVSVLYRIPGVIGFFYWLAALVAGFATFFSLNLQLTTDATVGIVAFIFVSLFVLFFSLNNFQQQVKQGNSLRQASLMNLKNTSIFSFDVYLVIFFSAIIFAFIAALELRGFGLILSIMAFMGLFVGSFFSTISNYILINFYPEHSQLFLPKKYRSYLKSLSGKIHAENDLGRKIISRKYFLRKSHEFNEKLIVNLFSWKVWIYLFLICTILVVGITLIFIPNVGFGSSFILKNGTQIDYHINNRTVLGAKSIDDALKALAPAKIGTLLNINLTQDILANNSNAFFLRTTSEVDVGKLTNLLNEWLQPNSYSIEATTSFSSQEIINSAFTNIVISLVIMSVYFVIRFNWISIIQLWFTSFFLIGFIMAFLTIIRITVNENIIGAILLLFILGLTTNVWLLNIFRMHYRKWNFYNKTEFYQLINKIMNEHGVAYAYQTGCFLIMGIVGAGFNWLQMQYLFVYWIIMVLGVGLTILPFGTIIWVLSMLLRQKLFYHHEYNSQGDLRLILKYRVKNHDLVDEQLITNINSFNS